MSAHPSETRRFRLAVLGIPAFALVLVATALAATPVKGGSYAGALAAPRTDIHVTFKVSTSGTQVTGLKTSNLPLYCQGGGPATPIHFKKAAISRTGTFTSTGKQIISSGPLKGQTGATLTITGRFLKGRRESGKIKTTYSKSPSCSGSSTYTTKA